MREYNAKRDSFVKKRISRTKNIDFSFESENQRVFLDETMKLNLLLERGKGGIQFIFIGRHTPDRRLSYVEDSDFNFEYLQEDMSWGDTFNYFDSKFGMKNRSNLEAICRHLKNSSYRILNQLELPKNLQSLLF